MTLKFNNMEPSQDIDEMIRECHEELAQRYSSIIHCRITVDSRSQYQLCMHQYRVLVYLTLASGRVISSREYHARHRDKSPQIAARKSFAQIERQLIEMKKSQASFTRQDSPAHHGYVARLFPSMDYGIIESTDGRSIYFQRDHVSHQSFDYLNEGDEVLFVERPDASRGQAMNVHIPLR
ncbi:MAG: HPF/RaiA family ribosome-associated protein [Alcanivorax sp.]|nr:HPF/RaiA family ribosome-associated protein [Alcanivorax sp.]